MRPFGCLLDNPPQLVLDLIDPRTATWDVQRLHEVFVSIDIPAILNIPLCTRNETDFWAWSHENNGIFSAKSAYIMLINTIHRREAWLENRAGSSNVESEAGSWKRLWNIQVPTKIRMFLWRLSKHSLPTNDVRAQRHMADSSPCGLCCAQDSWRHSLLDCTMSRCIWALVDGELADHLREITEPSAKQWMFSMINDMSHEAFTNMAVTRWATWSARRKAIHEVIFPSPQATHEFIKRFMADLEIIRERPAANEGY